MFTALLAFFVLFVAADAFFSAAVMYHLWKYTLPGWSAPKIVIPSYLALSAIFLVLALYSLWQIST